VVLKLGARGAMHASADGERTHLPATPAWVVDTTGAGDALCAGFLAAWLSGVSAADALRAGVKLAAGAVQRMGGRPET
jgi:sugar/nucleoside kinase (ribokinase family)